MIVYDLDFESVAISPYEADPPLLIYPHAELSFPITAKLFEPISGARQIAEFFCSTQHSQLAERRTLKVRRKPSRAAAIENRFGVGVGKARITFVLSVMHIASYVNASPPACEARRRARVADGPRAQPAHRTAQKCHRRSIARCSRRSASVGIEASVISVVTPTAEEDKGGAASGCDIRRIGHPRAIE
jgi:hypothetical protein